MYYKKRPLLWCIAMSVVLCTLSSQASMPVLGSHGAAGLELASSEAYGIGPGERQVVSTGVAMSLPLGRFGKIEGRSGLAVKHGIVVGGGVIDSDYTGEIKVILINTGNQTFVINKGDRIAILILQCHVVNPVVRVVEELPETKRGDDGVGSTDIQQYLKPDFALY